jgi:AGZA family xanthine/uracil permease-like MFS transporter
MPANDVALATSIATAMGTAIMGTVGNYPWVVSTQLGTNSYFVTELLQLGEPCGHHATFKGTGQFAGTPCECTASPSGPIPISPPADSPAWDQSDSVCLGTKIPFEQVRHRYR